MSAASTAPSARRELIAARQRRSLTWRVIHVLGSLKLALLLLATIALACAVATVCESRFDTKVAQAYIYKAPWFLLWLGVLCVNLFAVTLTRWPWQRQHLGFIITHYGIITLLIGAMIGSYFGFEGNVTLHRGAAPVDRITTSRSVLQIQNPVTGEFTANSFDVQISAPTEKHPREFAVPGAPSKVRLDDSTDILGWDERLAPADGPDARPGATMTFATQMMGQRVSLPFVLPAAGSMSRDFFGRAKMTFGPDLPKRAPWQITESQLVFARFAPVIQGDRGAATGIRATLGPDGKTILVAVPDGKTAELDRARVMGQPQKVGPATITAMEFWPDFALVNGRPATASAELKNPAVLLRVEAPRADGTGQPHLEIAPAAGGIAYQSGRGEFAISRGTARVGESFPLGWADWTATLTESLPHARIVTERRPGLAGETGPPGFRARLVGANGRTGPPQWIGSGDQATLALDETRATVAYGLEARRVPFTIGLKSFEVPRLEGTDTPANFIATVEFRDPQTGATKTDVAQMNQPASWPGTAFALLTGLNYKFSQAQWNPADLGETTLQVLYDPGWLLKWTGSLAICCGIFIMFYLRPKKS